MRSAGSGQDSSGAASAWTMGGAEGGSGGCFETSLRILPFAQVEALTSPLQFHLCLCSRPRTLSGNMESGDAARTSSTARQASCFTSRLHHKCCTYFNTAQCSGSSVLCLPRLEAPSPNPISDTSTHLMGSQETLRRLIIKAKWRFALIPQKGCEIKIKLDFGRTLHQTRQGIGIYEDLFSCYGVVCKEHGKT